MPDGLLRSCAGCGIQVRWGRHGVKNWRLVRVIDRRVPVAGNVASAIREDVQTSYKWCCDACLHQFADPECPETQEWLKEKCPGSKDVKKGKNVKRK